MTTRRIRQCIELLLLSLVVAPATGQEYQPACAAFVLAAGSRQSLLLRSDGEVWSWGENSWGQLGDGTTTDRPLPAHVLGVSPGFLGDAISVAAGGWHSLALKSDGTVWAWGSNVFGQLAQVVTPPALPIRLSATPLLAAGGPGVSAIAAGNHHSLLLRTDGTVSAWGDNEAGQLGDGSTTSADTPVAGAGLARIVAIAAGHNHSLALRSDGTVWSWGYNSNGQLGRTTAPLFHAVTAGQVSGLGDVKAIAAGSNHSLALRADGTVWTWGWNEDGQLGDGTFGNRAAPVQVVGPAGGGTFLVDIKAIAGAGRHSLALRSDGTAWAWGFNRHGQLGAPTEPAPHSNVPLQVREDTTGDFLSGLSLAAGGALHSLTWMVHGQVRAWGLDDRGQLGDEATTTTSQATIEVVSAELTCQECMTAFADVSAGQAHSVGLVGNGVVATWGDDVSGQLGDGSAGSGSPDPGFVNGSTGFTAAVAVAAGHQHTLALAPDGTVWAWGKNHRGQLGNGTSGTDSPLPVRVLDQATGLPMTNVIAVDAGGYHSMALRATGEVWAWGDNTYGQIGSSPIGGSSAYPVRVNALPLAASLAAGGDHSLAVAAAGSLWAWGRDNRGQLGDGLPLADSPSPVVVSFPFPPGEGVTAAAGGVEHSAARKDDGTVWSWGSNQYGQVGNDGMNDEPLPVPTLFPAPPDFRLAAVAAGDHHSLALRRDATEGGSAWGWGRNDSSQLGDTTTSSPRRTPVAVASLTGATGLDGGTAYSASRDDDGWLWAWGANGSGQLGDGTTAPASEPVPSARDIVPAPEGNIVRAVKVGFPDPQLDVYLEFNGATSFTGRWRVWRWENLKQRPVPAPPGALEVSGPLTITTYVDPDAVPLLPGKPTPFVYHYQVVGSCP